MPNEIRLEDYARGTPQDDVAKSRNGEIRAHIARWNEELTAEFPEGFELWDLVCGEIEAVDLRDGTSFRLYTLNFAEDDEPRLIIDDYMPSELSQIQLDDDGIPEDSDALLALEDELRLDDERLEP